ncbi:flagellar export protein FliJ [Cellulomonas sp. KRMCY2]|uniref:flagellar export protein FliJ n=1 Tax=Cellulomonas sp. KRMCY2 TaxID=1304865 RepID=UPI00045EAB01|nr:flagellar export protein FliJ [Cellulomonas sp. KRMCY2]
MAHPFRLAGLLRLRRLQEDEAAAELARTHAQRRAAEKRRDDTAEMLAGTTLPRHGDELTWQAAIAGRAALTGLVGEATATVAAINARVQAATDEWSAARTRATTLTKLEERHGLEVHAEEDRAEQAVLDEAAARGHRAAATTTTDLAVDDAQQGTTTASPTEEER